MRSRGGLTLLKVLFILVVFCKKYSEGLQCYSCVDPISNCNSTSTCLSLMDACLIAVAEPRIYHQCWMMSSCSFQDISKKLGEPELKYRCCQKDLCNRYLEETKDKEKDGTVTLSGKTTLLVLLVLVTSWNCFL